MSRDAIARLVHDYSDAVVHRNLDQWAGTWAPDAVWDLGKGRRPLTSEMWSPPRESQSTDWPSCAATSIVAAVR